MYSSDEVYRKQRAGRFDDVELIHDIFRLKALDHGLRLGIVQVLCHHDELSLKELCRQVAPNAGEQAVRKCVRELETAGYVSTQRLSRCGQRGKMLLIAWKTQKE